LSFLLALLLDPALLLGLSFGLLRVLGRGRKDAQQTDGQNPRKRR
jgi:hypothetical protein